MSGEQTTIDALAAKAADAVGVTPYSDMRLFVEQAVKYALESYSTPPAAEVTEGWQLVPKEPTEEMLDAYWHQTGESKEMRSRTHAYMRRYYSAMLSASPEPVGDRDVLIERLQQIHDEQRSILGQMLLDKSEEAQRASNWQGGKVNGIASAIAALAAREQQP